jgi:hypothetical protein
VKKVGQKHNPILTSTSYSTYANYKKCPAIVRFTKGEGLKTKQHAAADRGNTVHLKGEYFLKGTVKSVPPEFRMFAKELDKLKSVKAIPEQEWAVDENWKPVAWKSPKAFLRGKLDAHLMNGDTLVFIDFKTGRIYPDHESQASLYSPMGLGYYPSLKNAVAEFWYLDQGPNTKLGDSPFEFTLRQIKRLREEWHEKLSAMLKDTVMAPTPSEDSCKWCKLRSDKKLQDGKSGPCDEWRKVLK